MSQIDITTRKYEDTSYKKLYVSPYSKIKRKTVPYRITKKINNMKFSMDKIYHHFYLNSTDMKKEKAIEEYIKFQKYQRLRRKNYIKNLKYYFKQKNTEEISKHSKSTNNIFDMESLYSKIINTYIKRNIYNSQRKNNLLYIKKEETYRLNCITESHLLNFIKKIRTNKLIKEKIKRRKAVRGTIRTMKMIKSAKEINDVDKKNSKIFVLKKTFNKYQSMVSIDKNYRYRSSEKTSRVNSSIRRKDSINTKTMNTRMNSCININTRNKGVYNNYNSFVNKIISNDTQKKGKTILEIKKTAYKILPKLSSSFNSTIGKSTHLKKEINIFQKDSKIRANNSKKKKLKIMKKFFVQYDTPSIKSSLKVEKHKFWTNNMDKFITTKKDGTINLKFNLIKKNKSPLIFVEDYNKMRNRRRKNRNIEQNLGFIETKINKKINKNNVFLGMSFKDIKRVFN